jgi:hypothetical protein
MFLALGCRPAARCMETYLILEIDLWTTSRISEFLLSSSLGSLEQKSYLNSSDSP